jgi:hypothetical protein
MDGDQVLVCIDCGASFTFAVNEQRYFAARTLARPKRCSTCRLSRRQARDAEEATGQPSSIRAIGLAAETRGLRTRTSGWR